MKNSEIAVFGGGCFWCTEAIYKRVKGVLSVKPGYAGGETVEPTYQQVCSGRTGHAEVVQVQFDPQLVSYSDLLKIFWHVHDPTTLNQQGNDIGPQYRSIILYANEEQKEQANTSLKATDASGLFPQPIVTQIQPLGEFYLAEKNHHDYYANNLNQPYCRAIISPKVKHFMKDFEDKLK